MFEQHEEDSAAAQLLSCEDLSYAGYWKGRCCVDCHHHMTKEPMAGGFLEDISGETLFTSSHGLFGVRCCHVAFTALNKSLALSELRTTLELSLLQYELVFDLLQEVIDK